jgi:AGCS family alanine or glycine:cation symporter
MHRRAHHEDRIVTDWIDSAAAKLAEWLGAVLAFEILGFPMILIVLVAGSLGFTLYLRFINLRGFGHAIHIIRGRYDNADDPGQISHFQALTSALSATIGLGNIAGVAVAIARGGPGAVFWMIVLALFGMTAKFVSCSLSQVYRQFDEDGTVRGGPMYYLRLGLGAKGWPRLGMFFGGLYAVCTIAGSFGGGIFQTNQSYELVAIQVPLLASNGWLYGLLMAGLVAMVILGGIVRIGAATSRIVPSMCLIYVVSSLFIIGTHLESLPGVLSSILQQAFHPEAVYGGLLGVIVIGFGRAAFSNEAGLGSAAIAHSAAKTDEPIREGFVAMIGPFIDTVIICTMTASVILVTADDNALYREYRQAQSQVHATEMVMSSAPDDQAQAIAQREWEEASRVLQNKERGAALTSAAFGTVIEWFPILLSIAVFLFCFSTLISWYYYGEKAWGYLFGATSAVLFKLLFLSTIVVGSILQVGAVIALADLLVLSLAFPNLIGAAMLVPEVRQRLDDYWSRYREGAFD